MAKQLKSVALHEFVEANLPEPQWAVNNIWPKNASGLIAGQPKAGKSTTGAELAISLWSGSSMFGLDEFATVTTPTNVLYIQAENATSRVQRDFQQIMEARSLGHFTELHHGEWKGEQIVTRSFEIDEDSLLFSQTRITGPEHGCDARLDIIPQERINLSLDEDRQALAALIEANRYDYVFLDPLYMLIGIVDEKDSAQLKPILGWLTDVKVQCGCATILTAHMTSKSNKNNAASILGSTYIYAWYEAALLIAQDTGGVFTIHVDARRDGQPEMWHTLGGMGVGSWVYSKSAQGVSDKDGNRSPKTAKKKTNIEKMQTLLRGNPDLSNEQLAKSLSVSTKTIANYMKELSASPSDNNMLALIQGANE